MNIKSTRIAQVLLMCSAVAVAIMAQGWVGPPTYDLSWSTIDNGGGTSIGGGFDVSGTIGQPDASIVAMTGGTFEVRGGFWTGSVEPVDTCPADLAPGGGDGLVSTPDLLFIINAWGSCPILPTPCPADIAPPIGDNAVGVPDLLAVINAWGACL